MRAGGVRVAGKEPILYPDLGLELSAWFERRWRLDSQEYGFLNDRSISPNVNLYWVYAGLNYTWTTAGRQFHSPSPPAVRPVPIS
ncbi:MAG: hypothetical protein WDN00_07395 [Limisphaerales bacterium]